MSAWRKLSVYLPQLVGVAVATGSGMAWQALGTSHPILCAPFVVSTLVTSVVTFITGMQKTFDIDIRGWPDPPACKRCAHLEEENRALLEAIK